MVGRVHSNNSPHNHKFTFVFCVFHSEFRKRLLHMINFLYSCNHFFGIPARCISLDPPSFPFLLMTMVTPIEASTHRPSSPLSYTLLNTTIRQSLSLAKSIKGIRISHTVSNAKEKVSFAIRPISSTSFTPSKNSWAFAPPNCLTSTAGPLFFHFFHQCLEVTGQDNWDLAKQDQPKSFWF